NRFHFDEQVMRLDTKRQLPISIMIGDVNGLKLLNDSFGHQEGDKLLIEISNILRKATRAEDITSRWGGDEFAVLLPQTSSDNCSIVYQRIKDLCDKSMYKTIKPSIAIGFATKTTDEENINDIIKFAEEKMYAEKLSEGKIMRQELIDNVENKIFMKCDYEKEHIDNCINLAKEFSTFLNLSPEDKEHLLLLAKYHDIGFVNISETILNKPEKLSETECERIRSHSEVGSRIVQSINEIQVITELVLHHHEHYNGLGYPSQLKAEEIPYLSRVFTIIDAFSVMTSGRPYKDKKSLQEAFQELIQCSGTQFDPNLVTKFISMYKKR
ncbi:MAG: diguanylate cyclase, partial [Bacilli bacterium]|nr:diguanylate cyclase [Bacilli bacterium]